MNKPKHRLKGRHPSPRTNCAQRRAPRHRRCTGSTAVVRISAGALAAVCAVLLAVGDPTVRPADAVFPVPAAAVSPVERCGPLNVEVPRVLPAPTTRVVASTRRDVVTTAHKVSKRAEDEK